MSHVFHLLVASKILKFAKCSVACENMSVDVKPQKIILDPAVKFEVYSMRVLSSAILFGFGGGAEQRFFA